HPDRCPVQVLISSFVVYEQFPLIDPTRTRPTWRTCELIRPTQRSESAATSPTPSPARRWKAGTRCCTICSSTGSPDIPSPPRAMGGLHSHEEKETNSQKPPNTSLARAVSAGIRVLVTSTDAAQFRTEPSPMRN